MEKHYFFGMVVVAGFMVASCSNDFETAELALEPEVPAVSLHEQWVEQGSKFNNPTEQLLDELFANWADEIPDEITKTFSAPIDRNMIHPDNYEVLKDERWHKEFSYTITEADYNLATPCNGNCD